MSRRTGFIIIAIIILVGVGYLLFTRTQAGEELLTKLPGRGEVTAQADAAADMPFAAQGNGELPEDVSTVAIRPAESILGEVSASGNIELVSQRSVATEVAGEVDEIFVKPGDNVTVGDVLMALDSRELERDAQRARLSVESAKNKLDQLMEAADASDIEATEADLAEAIESLTDTLDGPSDEELEAARSSLISAQAKYDEFLEGPSGAELVQLAANLRKAEVALAKAQGDYDEIAWRNDAGITSQSATLQETTIDYESALAAYEEATADASDSDLASARSSIESARHTLEELLNSPTDAEVAQAEAKVAQARAALEDLQTGASTLEVREVEISLEQAVVDLEEAYSNLSKAQIAAPINGTMLKVNAELGERVQSGAAIATLADTSQLELTIDVAEIDITDVSAGQPASIVIDALPDNTFDGVVDYISPSSDSSSSLVNYAVTIRLENPLLDGVLPGMTAIATLMNTSSDLSNSWLVPQNSLRTNGNGTVVTVMRNGAPQPVQVVSTGSEGEWAVVQSNELRAGDQVVGSVTTYVGENEFQFGGGMSVPGGGGGTRPPGGGDRP